MASERSCEPRTILAREQTSLAEAHSLRLLARLILLWIERRQSQSSPSPRSRNRGRGRT